MLFFFFMYSSLLVDDITILYSVFKPLQVMFSTVMYSLCGFHLNC